VKNELLYPRDMQPGSQFSISVMVQMKIQQHNGSIVLLLASCIVCTYQLIVRLRNSVDPWYEYVSQVRWQFESMGSIS
jgi:hypothetical protein